MAKRDFADGIRDPEIDHFALSGGPEVIAGVLIRGRREGQNRRCDKGTGSWSDAGS